MIEAWWFWLFAAIVTICALPFAFILSLIFGWFGSKLASKFLDLFRRKKK